MKTGLETVLWTFLRMLNCKSCIGVDKPFVIVSESFWILKSFDNVMCPLHMSATSQNPLKYLSPYCNLASRLFPISTVKSLNLVLNVRYG